MVKNNFKKICNIYLRFKKWPKLGVKSENQTGGEVNNTKSHILQI